jgi:hypothetical protein
MMTNALDNVRTSYNALCNEIATLRAQNISPEVAKRTQSAERKLTALLRSIEVETYHYEREHNKRPSGRGNWAFCTVDPRRDDYLDHVIWVSGLYTDARETARRRAASDGFAVLYVCS